MKYQIKDRVLTKFEKEKGKLRFIKPNGAWTINLDNISECILKTEIDTFIWSTEKNTYTIPSITAFNKGFIREMGGERKLIVPINKHYMEINNAKTNVFR